MQGDRENPSVSETFLLSLVAVLLTLFAFVMIEAGSSDNVAGSLVADVLFVTFTIWVDWRVIGRWRRIARNSGASTVD